MLQGESCVLWQKEVCGWCCAAVLRSRQHLESVTMIRAMGSSGRDGYFEKTGGHLLLDYDGKRCDILGKLNILSL